MIKNWSPEVSNMHMTDSMGMACVCVQAGFCSCVPNLQLVLGTVCTSLSQHLVVVVSESNTFNTVKVFDSGGNLIHSFGSEMQSAQGICITPYGLHGPFIYVCDQDEQKWFRY